MIEIEHKKKFTADLRARSFDIQWHEDRQEPDIPDVSFGWNGVDGWLEFKYMARPKKAFNIPKFTAGQRQWLRERGKKGCGACFLVLGIGGTTAIIRWDLINVIWDKPWTNAIGCAAVWQTTDLAAWAFSEYLKQNFKEWTGFSSGTR